ncbi:hypothetical protein [Rhodanobacter sp. Root561]|uniref:hypothetical protein n=1 Tax=Rhodanobacter sp. Root561 TaxID=1736560 RepID=UPI0012F9A13F|nr:hypothetical protein [Rhodanobacter sp. Root561]
MNILTRIHGTSSSRGYGWWQSLAVAVNDEGFTVTEALRRERSVNYSATWSGISAVCFQDGGLGSDVFRIYTSSASNPILVPVEAVGGNLFWLQLTERELFPEFISARAVRSRSKSGTLWWPFAAER